MTQPQQASPEELGQMAAYFQQQLGLKEQQHAYETFQLNKEIARLTQALEEKGKEVTKNED